MIDFKNVNKLLGGRDILKDADFRINKGERIGFVGPNGAGKTTVFSMICGDMSPDKGEIIKPEKRGSVFCVSSLVFSKRNSRSSNM